MAGTSVTFVFYSPFQWIKPEIIRGILPPMRAAGRDTLLVTLSAAAAGLDAWSFFGLGQVFVANMTGNTVLLGFAAFGGSRAKALRTAVSLVCYAAGAFTGALLARPIRRRLEGCSPEQVLQMEWPMRATIILAIECLIVVVCALANGLWKPAQGSPGAVALIAALAFAVGLQSSAVNSLQLPGVATTYITGTWTVLSAGFAQLVDGEKQGEERVRWKTRLSLEGIVLVAYLGSAVCSGLLARRAGHTWMGMYPAILLLLTVASTARPWLRKRRSHIP